jgi:hypothetical protein
MINNLPTIYEVVTGSAKKQTKEKTPNSSSKSNKPSSKVVCMWSRSSCRPTLISAYKRNFVFAAVKGRVSFKG